MARPEDVAPKPSYRYGFDFSRFASEAAYYEVPCSGDCFFSHCCLCYALGKPCPNEKKTDAQMEKEKWFDEAFLKQIEDVYSSKRKEVRREVHS